MPTPRQEMTVHISTLTFLKALGAIAAVALALFLSDIIVVVFLSLVLAALIEPAAVALKKKGVPKAITVLGIYVALIGALSFVLSLIVPALVQESGEFVKNITRLVNEWLPSWVVIKNTADNFGFGLSGSSANSISGSIGNITSGIGSAAAGAFSTIRGVIGNVVAFVLVLVLAFYMVVEEDALRRALRVLLNERQHQLFTVLYTRVQQKMGEWLRGQLILMLIVGGMTYLGLTILGVKYALVLGILAGLMEFIPYVGPLLSLIPAVFMALSDSPIKAGLVVLLGLIIQQSENHILVPKVMQKATGLNPLLSIVAVMIGAKLGGAVGALLAIPMATAAMVIVQDYRLLKEEM